MQKAKRYRSKAYLRWVSMFPSCLTWEHLGQVEAALTSTASVPHHVRMWGWGGTGLKPSDYRVVPLTDAEHRDLHQYGEKSFWSDYGVDPRETIVMLLANWIVTCSEPHFKSVASLKEGYDERRRTDVDHALAWMIDELEIVADEVG